MVLFGFAAVWAVFVKPIEYVPMFFVDAFDQDILAVDKPFRLIMCDGNKSVCLFVGVVEEDAAESREEACEEDAVCAREFAEDVACNHERCFRCAMPGLRVTCGLGLRLRVSGAAYACDVMF